MNFMWFIIFWLGSGIGAQICLEIYCYYFDEKRPKEMIIPNIISGPFGLMFAFSTIGNLLANRNK